MSANLALPFLAEVIPERPFYSARAFASAQKTWRTPRELFLATCRYANGLSPETPEHLVPLPWVDPACNKDSALVPHFYTPEEDGLAQSWCPPPGAPDFVFNNPPYGNPEEVCKRKCKKKRCVQRGFHLSERVPGIEDWVVKERAEAMRWGMRTFNLLPFRGGASWFADIIRPGHEAGPWEGGDARPGQLSPFAPYWRTASWALYRWRFLEVEVIAIEGRIPFIPGEGDLTRSDVAGFDSAIVRFKGLGARQS